jgi:hypothetical protein
VTITVWRYRRDHWGNLTLIESRRFGVWDDAIAHLSAFPIAPATEIHIRFFLPGIGDE